MKNERRSFGKLVVAGALVVSFCSLGSGQTRTGGKPAADSEEYYKYSFGIFGGIQTWKLQQSTTNPNTLAPGGAVGVRADQDFLRYIGVEEAWTFYAVNNARFKAVSNPAYDVVGFGSRNGQVFIGPLFYLTPPSSPVRPFFTIGPGFQYFWMTRDAKNQGEARPAYNAPRLEGRNGPAIIFGGGVKSTFRERFAIRVDVHGVLAENPHFNLSEMATGPGSLFVKHRGSQLGLQATLGLDFKFGKKVPPPAPAPPPPPPPPPPPGPKDMTVNVSASPSTVCPGETVRVTASTNAPSPTYQWSINGEQTSTAETLNFGTTGRAAGTYNVSVTINAPGYNAGNGSTTVTVREYRPPSGTVSASPSEITVGQTSTISSNFNNQCGGNIQPATCTASEGTVSGNTYNSTGVQFDASIRGEQQKTVTITCTARDDRGSGSASTTVVVKKPANREATRLPDLVFARNNARVNNCGKRLLLEQLKTYLDQDPTGKVVFVGHVDGNEPNRTRLDQRRALNAAAIISAGSGICLNFAPANILVRGAGTEQGGVDFQPYFCGTAASPKTTERSGQAVNANDRRAQYRRVEVWFVPTNGNLPASAGDARDATSLGVTKLGCPK